ncbi:MAG: hypothetical protein GY807_15835 [Gammaproteobacteria bacterium]|nr:hypothetical protein [Gammaproteobacteria bacterium]
MKNKEKIILNGFKQGINNNCDVDTMENYEIKLPSNKAPPHLPPHIESSIRLRPMILVGLISFSLSEWFSVMSAS